MRKPKGMLKLGVVAFLAVTALTGCDGTLPATAASSAQQPQQMAMLPDMRWGDRSGGQDWTRAALAALEAEGVTLLSTVPRDVARFCPAYAALPPEGRKHFWAGLLSALAKHESGYNPGARGGGGRYLGLMRISPATAQHYDCEGKLLDGSSNMACAVKIAARNVARDQAIVGEGRNWRGIARDWMPLRSDEKRADIANWTRQQSYCGG